jgi:hypothetical protein
MYRSLISACLLFMCVLLIAWPTLDWPFRNDDYPQLLLVHDSSPWELFAHAQKDLHLEKHAWSHGESAARYRPVDELTWWINWQLFGWNVVGYHLTNVLIHFATSLGCFFVAQRFYASPPAGLAAGLLMALAGAATAPLFGGSLDNRSDSIPGALSIWTIYAWMRGGRHYLILLAAALFAKENAIFLPLVILLFEWLRSRRFAWEPLLVGCTYMAARVAVLGETGATQILTPYRSTLLSLVGQITDANWVWYNLALVPAIGWLLWRRPDHMIAAYYIMLLPMLLLFGAVEGRYTYPAAVFFFVWLAGGVAEKRPVAIALAVLSVLMGAGKFRFNYHEMKDVPYQAEQIMQSLKDEPSVLALVVPVMPFYNGLCEGVYLRWGTTDCATVLASRDAIHVRREGQDWLVTGANVWAPHARPTTGQWMQGRHADVLRQDQYLWRVRLKRVIKDCRNHIRGMPLWTCR